RGAWVAAGPLGEMGVTSIAWLRNLANIRAGSHLRREIRPRRRTARPPLRYALHSSVREVGAGRVVGVSGVRGHWRVRGRGGFGGGGVALPQDHGDALCGDGPELCAGEEPGGLLGLVPEGRRVPDERDGLIPADDGAGADDGEAVVGQLS